jgi:hypothetical protein
MSIHDQIRAWVEQGCLVQVVPILPHDPIVRTMLVTKELADFLNEESASDEQVSRRAALRADLEAFVKGDRISASLDPYRKSKECYIAVTDPVRDAIWSLRCRDPKPSYRLFGAFAERDVLVLFSCRERTLLGGLGDWAWRREIRAASAVWMRMFQYEKLQGDELSEFMTNYVDVGRSAVE